MVQRIYLKKIAAALTCQNNTKKALLRIVKNDIEAFLLEHPDATEQELIRQFGTPDELAESYLDSLDSSEVCMQIEKNGSVKKMLISCSCAIIGILLLLVIGIKGYLFFHHANAEYIHVKQYTPGEEYVVVRYHRP